MNHENCKQNIEYSINFKIQLQKKCLKILEFCKEFKTFSSFSIKNSTIINTEVINYFKFNVFS